MIIVGASGVSPAAQPRGHRHGGDSDDPKIPVAQREDQHPHVLQLVVPFATPLARHYPMSIYDSAWMNGAVIWCAGPVIQLPSLSASHALQERTFRLAKLPRAFEYVRTAYRITCRRHTPVSNRPVSKCDVVAVDRAVLAVRSHMPCYSAPPVSARVSANISRASGRAAVSHSISRGTCSGSNTMIASDSRSTSCLMHTYPLSLTYTSVACRASVRHAMESAPFGVVSSSSAKYSKGRCNQPLWVGVSPAARVPGFARSRAANNAAQLRRASTATYRRGGAVPALRARIPDAVDHRPHTFGTAGRSRLRRAVFMGGSAPHTPTFSSSGGRGGGAGFRRVAAAPGAAAAVVGAAGAGFRNAIAAPRQHCTVAHAVFASTGRAGEQNLGNYCNVLISIANKILAHIAIKWYIIIVGCARHRSRDRGGGNGAEG